MSVGINLDGTIQDARGALLSVLNRLFHKDFRSNDLTEYSLHAPFGVEVREISRPAGEPVSLVLAVLADYTGGHAQRLL